MGVWDCVGCFVVVATVSKEASHGIVVTKEGTACLSILIDRSMVDN